MDGLFKQAKDDLYQYVYGQDDIAELMGIMARKQKNSGFSLTEVLLSVGTLAIGMCFIAGVFPVAIYLATLSSERTTAAVVADEAFAKIELYEIDPEDPEISDNHLEPIFNVSKSAIDPNEYFYPSTSENLSRKQYCWSALCRRTAPTTRDVQVTVFVCRKVGGATAPIVPQDVDVSGAAGSRELGIDADKRSWINDGYTIVENTTGEIYRVLERFTPPEDAVILLDKPWQGGNKVWVVPPQLGGREPCVGVYQKVMRF